MNNIDFERALNALDPAARLSDERTEAQIANDLREIKNAPEIRASRRSPWIAGSSIAAAAAVIAVGAAFRTPFGHTPTYAATPPMLSLKPTAADLGDVMDRATTQLRSAGAPEAVRRASFE